MLSNVTHSNSYFECNKKRGCIDQLYIELGFLQKKIVKWPRYSPITHSVESNLWNQNVFVFLFPAYIKNIFFLQGSCFFFEGENKKGFQKSVFSLVICILLVDIFSTFTQSDSRLTIGKKNNLILKYGSKEKGSSLYTWSILQRTLQKKKY